MNIELKRIAEKKLEQMGGDVCGVLVRKDGKLAAVDEHGRVQWLQDRQDISDSRAEFENRFPVPEGVFWDLEFARYSCDDGEFGPDADEYHQMWQVWQAARAQQGSVPEGWVKCRERLPEPRDSGRKAPNGILIKFDTGRIAQVHDVTETLVARMKNGPRQPAKFEAPTPPRIVEWMDLDSPQPPQEGGADE